MFDATTEVCRFCGAVFECPITSDRDTCDECTDGLVEDVLVDEEEQTMQDCPFSPDDFVDDRS